MDSDLGIIFNTVEDRIQNAILTGKDSTATPKNELAIRSLNALSGRNATSVSANSEPGDYCASWKRIRKEKDTTCVEFKWWDSKQNSKRCKWIVGLRYTFWPATTLITPNMVRKGQNFAKFKHICLFYQLCSIKFDWILIVSPNPIKPDKLKSQLRYIYHRFY